MSIKTNPNPPRSIRPTFIRFSSESHDVLEDIRYRRQRTERRHVTKTELLEEAVRLLLAAQAHPNSSR